VSGLVAIHWIVFFFLQMFISMSILFACIELLIEKKCKVADLLFWMIISIVTIVLALTLPAL
jgi:uncharacterized membrane protein YbhN (UPF0104 family)